VIIAKGKTDHALLAIRDGARCTRFHGLDDPGRRAQALDRRRLKPKVRSSSMPAR
jgi:hypothetical protein